jgi:DNA-damage-inducible protein J
MKISYEGIPMANTALIQVRVDPHLKSDAEHALADNGLDIATAIRMFLTKVRRVHGIPFTVRAYSDETLAAMEEAEAISRDPGAKSYSSFSELLEEVKAENGA